MKKAIPLIIATSLLIAIFLYMMAFKNPQHAIEQQSMGETNAPRPAPDFLLVGPGSDKGFTLADLKGKPAIVNFWATWCPPCRAELPSMNRAWDKIKDKGISMIAINVGEDMDTIIGFQDIQPINFTVLADTDGQVSQSWGMRGLPTTYILNPKGEIVYTIVGDREWDDDALLAKVEALK